MWETIKGVGMAAGDLSMAAYDGARKAGVALQEAWHGLTDDQMAEDQDRIHRYNLNSAEQWRLHNAKVDLGLLNLAQMLVCHREKQLCCWMSKVITRLHCRFERLHALGIVATPVERHPAAEGDPIRVVIRPGENQGAMRDRFIPRSARRADERPPWAGDHSGLGHGAVGLHRAGPAGGGDWF